jgi:hypothetical protein
MSRELSLEQEWMNLYSPDSTSIPAAPTVTRGIADLIAWLNSGVERDADGKMVLRNPLSDQNRQRLQQRRDDLRKSICLINRHQMMSDIATLLMCFRPYLVMTKEEVQKIVISYVTQLKGVPTWAVSRACYQIRTGAAPDISQDHPPSTIRVRVLAMSIAQPAITEVVQIERLLTARAYVPPATPEQRAHVNEGFGKLVRDLAAKVNVASDPASDEARERTLQRLTTFGNRAIEGVYAEAGVEPRRSGGMLISPSLARAVGGTALPKQRKRGKAA